MYALKTDATTKIPGFIQLRDENFILIAHFRTSNIINGLINNGLEPSRLLVTKIENLKTGVLEKIDFDER